MRTTVLLLLLLVTTGCGSSNETNSGQIVVDYLKAQEKAEEDKLYKKEEARIKELSEQGMAEQASWDKILKLAKSDRERQAVDETYAPVIKQINAEWETILKNRRDRGVE